MSAAAIFPVGTNTSSHGIDGLDSNSYTAQRLKHASHEHLHLTSRRFFIGPIPEGWLNSNRKSWYKRRLELLSSSSRNATFDAATPNQRARSGSLIIQPSLAARMNFSFPQPTDVHDEANGTDTDGEGQADQTDGDDNVDDYEEEEDDDEDLQPTTIAPIATQDAQLLGITDRRDASQPKILSVPDEHGLDGVGFGASTLSLAESRPRSDSWKTAQEVLSNVPQPINSTDQNSINGDPTGINERPSTSTRNADTMHSQSNAMGETPDNIDGSSKTALLQPESSSLGPGSTRAQAESLPSSPEVKKANLRTMTHQEPAPETGSIAPRRRDQQAPGVRFKVVEGVTDRKRRIGHRAGNARSKVANKMSRRSTLKEGAVVKMERMLVRIDVTMQQLEDDFDENESLKTEARVIEKWREYMVVARKSLKQDDEDYRLQMYKTRVIPETETEQTKKKPTREIKLLPRSTHVNLFSSLDKTIVVWHPYRKGTRIFMMKPSSSAHSVEWYTFLRDALGSHRPATLQVNVPDLEVALHVERPFASLQATNGGGSDVNVVMTKAAEAEKAVAGKIVAQSMEMLEGDPEWSRVLEKWSETANMGLAWKRYDRLEWIYGVNEQKMYGSMAMLHTHDLELRPKQHYPTHTFGKKGVSIEEPAPVEGFLIRLTSQKGLHKQWGKAFFKRLYFSTFDQFLVFNRPAKATPPHPPRLATIRNSSVPSAHDIIENTPTMYDIEPFTLHDEGGIAWLKPGRAEVIGQSDAEAVEEVRRNLSNLIASDGYINMCHIVKVRKLKWGAAETDEALDSGDDVDFHMDVDNTRHEDGTTTEIDDSRTFELVLANGLVIRLQAYSDEARNEWMKRLRKLIAYWKIRTSADMTSLKATRNANLKTLDIDEDQEARIGQFARKWEVSRSEANPELYNMCRLTGCRTITMSGTLYRKPRRRSTFQQCSVFLAGGQMLIFQSALRKGTGEQVPHIHQDKQQIVDLKDCYVYSGLVVEDDLLYQNRTFDTNHAGMLASTPRVYLNDSWTTSDVDVMTCFVIWMNRRKGWFRSVTPATTNNDADQGGDGKGGKKSQLKRVAQLGVPGRGMVFKCRSRAERDLWVTAVLAEIENAVEKALCEQGKGKGEDLIDARLEH